MKQRVFNKRSRQANHPPLPEQLEYGEIAVNFHKGSERLYIKNDLTGGTGNKITEFYPSSKIDAIENEISSHNHNDKYLSLTGGTVTGNIHAPGFFQDSDEKLKNFKEDLTIDLDELKNIPKKYFSWKKDKNENLKIEIGTSAQKVQSYFPEIVSENEDGILSVDYSKLSVIALSAIDKLNEENKELKNRINNLENEFKKLKK